MKTKINQRKDKIARNAISVFAEKGFKASTIAQLAKNVGLVEATIYKYFKNKEEILLYTVVSYMSDFMKNLDEQLWGIKNPEEKLRKFIWQYLRWFQKHIDFMKVFIFEIHPNPNYYHSEAYDQMKKAVGVIGDILNEGKAAGLFRKGVPGGLFRNFIMGTINYLFKTRIIFDRPFEVTDDFEDVTGVVLASIRDDEDSSLKDLKHVKDKRERILIAAEELFSKKMCYETTIAEIANRADVADGTIYEYFKSKEDLLFSNFEKQMTWFNESFDETLSPVRPETKLKYILWHYFNYAKENRQWIKIYLKDLIPNSNFYRSNNYELMRNYNDKINGIFKEGKEQGVFRKEVKTYLIRSMIFGTIDHICSPWAMMEREYNLIDGLDDFYELVYRGVKTADSDKPQAVKK